MSPRRGLGTVAAWPVSTGIIHVEEASPGAGRVVIVLLRQGARPLGMGIAIGLVLAWLLGKALAVVLFQVGAFDLLTFTVIPVLLLGVSSVALLVPAKRAASVAPVIALRAE